MPPITSEEALKRALQSNMRQRARLEDQRQELSAELDELFAIGQKYMPKVQMAGWAGVTRDRVYEGLARYETVTIKLNGGAE